MPTNHREDEDEEPLHDELEIEPVVDEDDVIDYTDDQVVELDEDVEDIDLDKLTALEGPDFF
jgi:hypothetical protein